MAIVINTNTVSSNWKSLSSTLPPPSKRQKSTTDDKGLKNQVTAVASAIQPRITKVVCLDCEMVGIGENGIDNMLARVSLVNQLGECIYDKYVEPREQIVDYRTHVSGITPQLLEQGIPFETVQKEVADIINGKILVGHAIHNDLKVLFLSHPKRKIRDTQRYKEFRSLFNGGLPSLKALVEKVLGMKIQIGEHDSVEDARATLQLYLQNRRQWESLLRDRKRTPQLSSQEKHQRITTRKKEKQQKEKLKKNLL